VRFARFLPLALTACSGAQLGDAQDTPPAVDWRTRLEDWFPIAAASGHLCTAGDTKQEGFAAADLCFVDGTAGFCAKNYGDGFRGPFVYESPRLRFTLVVEPDKLALFTTGWAPDGGRYRVEGSIIDAAGSRRGFHFERTLCGL
jgi:hypothetical protein